MSITVTSKGLVKRLIVDDVAQGLEPLQYSGDCLQPVERYLRGLPDQVLHGLGVETATATVSFGYFRCRKCKPCLIARSKQWTARCADEIRASYRTWFGTLTLHPTWQMRILAGARVRLDQGGTDFETLSDQEQFSELCDEATPLLTKYLKRVRKESGAPLRYVLCAEAHKSGLPHWHMLIHEGSPELGVRKEMLDRQWPHGFTRWKLAEHIAATAHYVSKYVSKDARTRIRASQRYGATYASTVEVSASLNQTKMPVRKSVRTRSATF